MESWDEGFDIKIWIQAERSPAETPRAEGQAGACAGEHSRVSNSCPSNAIASLPLLLYYSQLELDHKEAEARESAEVAAMYSGKLSNMEKKMKDEMNKEDESYIEITIPYSLL